MYKFKNKQSGLEVTAMKFSFNCLDSRFTESIIFEKFAESLPYTCDEHTFKLYGGNEVPEGYWIVKNNEGFYFPILEKELLDKYNLVNSHKSHKFDTTIMTVPFVSHGEFYQQIKFGDGSCEVKPFEFTDDTLTTPIPNVMVDGVSDLMDKILEANGISTTNQ